MLIGLGNSLRADDSFGIHIVNHMSKAHPHLADYLAFKGDMFNLPLIWKDRDLLIVDAVKFDEKELEIFEFDNISELQKFSNGIHNSHGFGLSEMLSFSELTKTLPKSIYFLGLSLSNYGLGDEMNPGISEKLPLIEYRLLKKVMTLSNQYFLLETVY